MLKRVRGSHAAILILVAFALSGPASGLDCHSEYDGSERDNGERHCYFRIFVMEVKSEQDNLGNWSWVPVGRIADSFLS